jgi:hypothetical protein
VIANCTRLTDESRELLRQDVSALFHAVTALEQADLDAHVKNMARAGVVEIRIPYGDESWGWAARVFPWEATIALLTKPYREETRRLTVIRHLAAATQRPARAALPTSLLIVRSGPGEIGKMYDLESECVMVSEKLPLAAAMPSGEKVLREPDRQALASALTNAPSILHLAGVDLLLLPRVHRHLSGDVSGERPRLSRLLAQRQGLVEHARVQK